MKTKKNPRTSKKNSNRKVLTKTKTKHTYEKRIYMVIKMILWSLGRSIVHLRIILLIIMESWISNESLRYRLTDLCSHTERIWSMKFKNKRRNKQRENKIQMIIYRPSPETSQIYIAYTEWLQQTVKLKWNRDKEHFVFVVRFKSKSTTYTHQMLESLYCRTSFKWCLKLNLYFSSLSHDTIILFILSSVK